MASQKAQFLRCAASFVIAAYTTRTPHSLGFARLELEAFCFAIPTMAIEILQ
jgi:hypothetical protein